MTTQPGSRIRISEATPDGETVASTTASSNAQLTPIAPGAVRVTAGTGVNIVTFENEPLGPPQTGCTSAIKVAAGNVTVSEAPTDGTYVSAISALPSSALGVTNLNNGTATVVVPVSADSVRLVERGRPDRCRHTGGRDSDRPRRVQRVLGNTP